ncbi:hypothetical protein [Streptomyces sp. NPDC017988]|uniref:hypothetical protein n=1 Tax=Streptomyces sp. NPDC017988 TaxID=3365025 RepID=UPI00379FD805
MGILAHHITFDGWSAGVLLREVGEFCRYFTQPPVDGEVSRGLPELTVQDRHFTAWERGRLSSDRLGKLPAYRRNRLEGRQPLFQVWFDVHSFTAAEGGTGRCEG